MRARGWAVLVLCGGALAPLGPGAGSAAAATYARAYSLGTSTQMSLTPEGIAATSDGGSIALGLTEDAHGVGVTLLLKLGAQGQPQWQREVGCLGTGVPPGDFAYGATVQQTSDGGYVLAGGTIGCGSGSTCPPSGGYQCALVDKFTSLGQLSWSRVYNAGSRGSGITSIRQTSDGGYIAVGNIVLPGPANGALVMKLTSTGGVQWQRQLGPSGSSQAYFNAVQQTSDGGYVATGQTYVTNTSFPESSVLAVKFSAAGAIAWTRGFNDFGSQGVATASNSAHSIVQAPDGGYLIGGNWALGAPYTTQAGALLVKLTAIGALQWEKAYSAQSTSSGGVVYSAHNAPGGGYLISGDGLTLVKNIDYLEPWMAKVDSAGTVLWERSYYQTYAPTGLPLSEYFSSLTLPVGGGLLSVGYTENYTTQVGELFGISTDGSGLITGCRDVHSPLALQTVNPALTTFIPALTVAGLTTAPAPSPSTTQSVPVFTQVDC